MWPLIKSGDLWQRIGEAVVAKGPRGFRASEVKGHATEEMVNESLVKPKDKEGHDTSDKVANKGEELTGVIAVALGYVYARGHKRYKTPMGRIQRSS